MSSNPLANLKESLDVEPTEGRLRSHGHRVGLASPAFLVALQKELEALMGTPAKAPVYMAGEKVALAEAEAFQTRLEASEASDADPGIVMTSIAQALTGRGYGRFEVVDATPEPPMTTFTIQNSILVEGYGPAKTPICHYFAGYVAGLLKALLGRDIHCEEVACEAMGRDACEFRVAPLENFEDLLLQLAQGR